MLDAARTALAAHTASERATTATIKRATVTTSPVGGDQLDWSTPVTVTTLDCRVQPASAERLEREGLQQKVDTKVIHFDDYALTPETHRVFIGSVVYRIARVNRWTSSHVETICEVIDGG